MIMKIKFQHVISITTSLGKPQLKMFPKNLNLCMSPPDANKLIQVSSNEPNLNFAFHKLYDEKNKDDELFFFIYIGPYGLHTYNALIMSAQRKIVL